MTRKILSLLLAAVLVTTLLASEAVAEPWKFVVMADSQGYSSRRGASDDTNGVGVKTLGAIVKDVTANVKPQLILFAGDLVYGEKTPAGLEKQLMTFRNTMAPAYQAKIPVYAIRGSHDVGPNVYQPWSNAVWNKVFSGPYAMPTNGPAGEKGVTYSVTHKNAFFVGIDCYKTPGGRKLTINQPWLDKQLKANKQPHVFAFSHTQLKKVEHSESLDQTPSMRNAFFKSLVAAGGRTYFCGHMHLSNYTALNNDAADPKKASAADDFLQVIVPPAGLKFYRWKRQVYDGNKIPGWTPKKVHHDEYKPGYVVVEVDGLKVAITTRLRKGAQFAPAATYTYTLAAKK